MTFHQSAVITSAMGEQVGLLRGVVVDRDDLQSVTHFVVEACSSGEVGLIPAEEIVDTPDESTLVLARDAGLDRLMAFAGQQYLRKKSGLGVTYVPRAVDRPAGRQEPAAPDDASLRDLEIGMPVVTRGDERIGDVESVVRAEDGAIEAVVARRDRRWRRVIPVTWMFAVDDGRVRLAVPMSLVEDEAADVEDPPTS